MTCLPSRQPLRGRARERGVIAVEFALMATLLMTVLFSVSEYGRAMYQYETLVKSTRSATRYLAQFSSGDTTASSQARCLAVYGTTACGNTPLVPGLTTAMVTIKDAATNPATQAMQRTLPAPNGTFVNLVTVTVTGFRFQPVVSAVVPGFVFDDIAATMPQVN